MTPQAWAVANVVGCTNLLAERGTCVACAGSLWLLASACKAHAVKGLVLPSVALQGLLALAEALLWGIAVSVLGVWLPFSRWWL